VVDVTNMYQFGAYTECFGVGPFVLEQYQLRRLDQLRIFGRMAMRGVLSFYNSQTKVERYVSSSLHLLGIDHYFVQW